MCASRMESVAIACGWRKTPPAVVCVLSTRTGPAPGTATVASINPFLTNHCSSSVVLRKRQNLDSTGNRDKIKSPLPKFRPAGSSGEGSVGIDVPEVRRERATVLRAIDLLLEEDDVSTALVQGRRLGPGRHSGTCGTGQNHPPDTSSSPG